MSGFSRTSEKLAQRVRRALKRQLVPRDGVRRKPLRLEPFVIARELSAQHRRHVDDDHRRPAGIRIDVQQMIEADVEARFFARLADGGRRHQFAAIDESARKHPLPIAGLDRPPDEHDLIVAVADDRADGDLRILIEDEPASRADQPVRFRRS